MFICWVRRVFALVSASLLLLATTTGIASAQAPQVIWTAPNPGGISTSAGAVAWSPSGTTVATGLLDRWMRTRDASNGNEVRAILQPHRSGGVINLTFSTDNGQYLAVGNQSGTGTFRVYRVSTGDFLGALVATIDSAGILRFAPDAQLATSPAKDLALWRTNEVTVFSVTGSGYDKVSTARTLSPNGQYQLAATSKGTITIQRTSDRSVVRAFSGGTRPAFSPDSTMVADWTSTPNQITVRRISDGAVVRTFATPGYGGVLTRFTPDGTRVVGSGYLPFLKPDGTWDQKGVIRFWSMTNGTLLKTYDQQTSLAVTTPVVFSPGGSRFLYGTYDGSFVVAVTPTT
jgi:WD40 repeat protein